MKRVLVPIDLSEVSEEALRYAVNCPCAETRTLILLHAIDPLDIAGLGLVGMANREEEMRDELQAEAQKRLDELSRKYARDGLNFETRLVFDRPWRAIINVAIEEQADAIVMGSHGRGVIAEQFLGSVAEKVVRKAPTPVTIIRPKTMRKRLIERWRQLGRE